MPQRIEVPGQGIVEFPDGMSDADIAKAIQSSMAPSAPSQQGQSGGIGQMLGDLAAGGIRGAGSIGATLLAPIDYAARKLNDGKPVDVGLGVQLGIDRRPSMDQALRTMGADPESMAFKTGKVGAEIAGTSGVGGVLANTVGRFAPGATGLIEALRTGGMSGPDMLTRVAGGAATGGVAAGMVNPEDAKTGAMIGGSLPVLGKVASSVGPVAKRTLGATTGVGDEAIQQAYQAGKAGGAQGKAFSEALRGQAGIDDVLTSAKQNLQAMAAQKQQAYRSGMANIKSDQTVLSFDGINDAVKKAAGMATFKGQAKNPQAADAVNDVAATVDEWMRLNPAEYHTPEGLDALKQRIGAKLESIPFEQKTARAAVSDIYNSIKSEISKQAPEYSRVMKDYSQASELISEIERSLSLGQKASADTAMRKLQSLMRNNVNTSYGYRSQLASELERAGGRSMMPALAGQAMSEWAPRGIQRATTAATGGGLAFTGNLPAAAGMAALSSPRLVGEGAYAMGRASNLVNPQLIEALRKGSYTVAPILGAQ